METTWIWIALGIIAVTILCLFFLRRKKTPQGLGKEVEVGEKETVSPPPVATVDKYGTGFAKTKGKIAEGLAQLFGKASAGNKLWDDLEEVLLSADVGLGTSQFVLESARAKNPKTLPEVRRALKEVMLSLLGENEGAVTPSSKPWVVSLVGVNGAGKTTTAAKLAHKYQQAGKTVLLGATDTFRAAAIEQLETWAGRVGTELVKGRAGGDPAAVAFDSVSAGKARDKDVVILDTAGRLHTKSGLMDELAKLHRVIKKVIPEAPHETWLVVDGTSGQNAIAQAKEFQSSLPLTGIVVTKLDGTSKGGSLLAIRKETGLTVKFIGVGETTEDLLPFDSKRFVDAILGADVA